MTPEILAAIIPDHFQCLITICVTRKSNYGDFLFAVAAFDLDSSFMQRDLGKLEEGANLCVYSELQPITFKLKERIGLRNLSEIENYVYRDSHDSTDSLHTIITRWIESSQPNIKPTWTDLIQFLEEFGEKKMFTSKLKHYLTSAPRDVSTKEINFEEESKLLRIHNHNIILWG